MRRTAITTTTIAMTIALGAALVGCTTSPTPTPEEQGQSVEDACLQLRSAVTAAGDDVNTATATLFDDPEGAAAQVTMGARDFADVLATIDNAELRAASEPISDAMIRFGEAVTAHGADASDANAGAIVEAGDEISASLTAIGELCE